MKVDVDNLPTCCYCKLPRFHVKAFRVLDHPDELAIMCNT